MVRALHRALEAWEGDPEIGIVVIRGEGRAFSAGGDIQHIYRLGKAGAPPYDFFADEYRLNAYIHRYTKPYIALVNGIVMGGGVGVSFHGSHRVMTENAIFAMPEVGIGFFPDIGGSFLLSRLPNEFGLYAGLTGNRIRWGDALWSGLATHAVAAADLEAAFAQLLRADEPEPALREFLQTPPRETDDATLHEITELFSVDSLADLLAGLERRAARGSEFARTVLDTLRQRSPTSLHVAFIQIRTAASLTMDECMRMDFRIVNRMLHGHDFYEGIRATVIEKGARPQWRPARIEDVSPEEVEAYFKPLGDRELVL
jgi:enoyl-CoA hydratase/carnithine racemase